MVQKKKLDKRFKNGHKNFSFCIAFKHILISVISYHLMFIYYLSHITLTFLKLAKIEET